MRLMIPVLLLASASLGFSQEDEMTMFGSCAVVTNTDDFTDEVTSHTLACADNDGGHGVGAVCYTDSGRSVVQAVMFIVPGVYLQDGAKVTLKYRFDQTEAFIGRATALNNNGVLITKSQYEDFLSGLAGSEETFVFQLNDDTRRLDLSETDGEGAVAEFTSRCQEASEAS